MTHRLRVCQFGAPPPMKTASIPRSGVGRLDIFGEVQRQEAAGFSESPVRATEIGPGPARGRSSSRRPGSAFQPISSSPPESSKSGRFGGRGRERGVLVADRRSRRFVVPCLLVATMPLFRESTPSIPSPSPTTPNMVRGRGQKSVGTLTQCGRSGLLPLQECPNPGERGCGESLQAKKQKYRVTSVAMYQINLPVQIIIRPRRRPIVTASVRLAA